MNRKIAVVLTRIGLALALTGTLFQTTGCTLGETIDSWLGMYGLTQFLNTLMLYGYGI